jgi:hypothetical protein
MMLQCAEIRGNLLPLPQSNSSGENETVLVEELVETKEKLLQALKLIEEKACHYLFSVVCLESLI